MFSYLGPDSHIVHAREIRKDEEFEARRHFCYFGSSGASLFIRICLQNINSFVAVEPGGHFR
jgi:hypothetical protein